MTGCRNHISFALLIFTRVRTILRKTYIMNAYAFGSWLWIRISATFLNPRNDNNIILGIHTYKMNKQTAYVFVYAYNKSDEIIDNRGFIAYMDQINFIRSIFIKSKLVLVLTNWFEEWAKTRNRFTKPKRHTERESCFEYSIFANNLSNFIHGKSELIIGEGKMLHVVLRKDTTPGLSRYGLIWWWSGRSLKRYFYSRINVSWWPMYCFTYYLSFARLQYS